MKHLSLILITLFAGISSGYGQNITGKWNGLLKVQGMQLRVVFNISQTNGAYTATMDSPDQGAKDIPVTSVAFENSVVKLAVVAAGIEYEGTLGIDNIIVGQFKQGGHSFPMNLSLEKIGQNEIGRYQEPRKPYPYYSEDVTFQNEAEGIKLAGTLTLPKAEGVYPVVVLISGSGPQNRDEEILGHKPFLVLADHLTRKGIGVLRFDDRGTASSKGNFQSATTAHFAKDAEAAVNYLKTRKEVNKLKIGLIGHSEGGLIAPMIASDSKDIAFIVLLAGTGLRGDKLLLKQTELIAKASGWTDTDLKTLKTINTGAYEIVLKSQNADELKKDFRGYMKQVLIAHPSLPRPQGFTSDSSFLSLQVEQMCSPWMRFFVQYDPTIALMKVKCPVLAIIGEKDLQVPPKENLQAIETSLIKGGNTNLVVKELKNLNHLFQECETGSPAEYSKIEQTLSPDALTLVSNWIETQVK